MGIMDILAGFSEVEWGCILLSLSIGYDWYDWYQWNNIYSIGIALVKCISLWGQNISVGFSEVEWGYMVPME